MKKIKELYQETILQHSKKPVNEKEMADPDLMIRAYNPMCGDKYTFYLKVENEVIKEASFSGYGCSISKASSSILMKKIVGMSIQETSALVKVFMEILDPESAHATSDLSQDKELLAFSATRSFPERIQCAALGWKKVGECISNLLNS